MIFALCENVNLRFAHNGFLLLLRFVFVFAFVVHSLIVLQNSTVCVIKPLFTAYCSIYRQQLLTGVKTGCVICGGCGFYSFYFALVYLIIDGIYLA